MPSGRALCPAARALVMSVFHTQGRCAGSNSGTRGCSCLSMRPPQGRLRSVRALVYESGWQQGPLLGSLPCLRGSG